MSDRGSNSGSRSLIEYEDVAPGKSASQVGSSVSRASEAARRAAAEVRARTARRRATRELEIAAIRDEIVEVEAEGAKEALEIEDEVFQRELRKTGSPGRRSISEPRGVRSWEPDGQLRRVREEETKTSCMVMCGATGSNAARSGSHQSIIPGKPFREDEGGPQATDAEESCTTRPEEPFKFPCATEDTEEGRRNRVEAWVSETTIQEADWKDSEGSGTIYRDQDVRVRMPERTSGHVHSAPQRRSGANSTAQRIEQDLEQGARGKLNVASSRRSVLSMDLRPKKRSSKASEAIGGSQNFRRRSGESAGVHLSQTPRITSPRKTTDTAHSGWEETHFAHQSARKSNLDPQDEMSLTDYADLSSISQHERRSERESYLVRDRTRPESPFYSPHENDTFRKNRPSRHSKETPCVRVDASRVIRSYPESRHTSEFETPSRVPAPDDYRDEDLLRHPSTQVQDTYAETSSTRSARRRPRSPQYETPRREGMERSMGPARETPRANCTGESTINGMAALIGALQAPKVDLPTFKGDPMQ